MSDTHCPNCNARLETTAMLCPSGCHSAGLVGRQDSTLAASMFRPFTGGITTEVDDAQLPDTLDIVAGNGTVVRYRKECAQ